MSTTEIIWAILGSSLLSTALSSWVNWEAQKRNYKKEYYKKILDKRIAAYEKVNELNSRLATYVQTENGLVHAHFSGQEPLNFFCNQIRSCIDDNLWLGNEIGTILTELNTFIINEFDNKIDPNESSKRGNSRIRDIAKEKYDEIDAFKKRLKFLVSRDIKDLHEIDIFFNEPANRKGFPLYPRKHKDPSDKNYYE